MKHILVPTDFSNLANNALKIAIDIAKHTDTTLHLVHAVEIMHIWDEVSNYVGIKPQGEEGYSYMNILSEKAREKLEEIKKDVNDEGVQCDISVLLGKPHEIILEYIKKNNINLVLLGTKGISGLSEILIGSNAQKIIRKSSCPVLTIKENTTSIDFNQFVVASDFLEDHVNNNLNYIAKLAEYYQARLTLLFILTPLNFVPEEEIKKRIEEIAQKKTLANYQIVVFKAETAEEGILEYCQLKAPSVLAMSTHGKGFLRKLFISNTTEYLANHIETPLLSMPIIHEDV